MKPTSARKAAYAAGYDEVSSGESSFASSRQSPDRLSKSQLEWQRRQQRAAQGNNNQNPFNPFGIAVRHLDSSSDGDLEQNSSSNRLNNTTETGNTHLSKYDYSQVEGLEHSRTSSTMSTKKASGSKSFSNSSFSFSRSMNNKSGSGSSKKDKKSSKKSSKNNKSRSKSLNDSRGVHNNTTTTTTTTKSEGREGGDPALVTPRKSNSSMHQNTSSYSYGQHSRSMQSTTLGSSMMSSLMPSMNLISSSSEEEEESVDSQSQYGPSPSKPRFLQELQTSIEEEPPPKYYHPAYWNARLSRREVYSRHYRPSRKEQDELNELEQFLGIPDARKNKKNVILYQWMQLNPSESDAKRDGFPRSIVLKRGPVAWSNHDECELILLTRGFVVARKVFQYIPRFQTSDVWTNVNKITPTGLNTFAICCGARKTLSFTCPTAADKDAWIQALKIVVLQAHTHSSFNPKNEREYDMGWQYRLIHTPWFTEAVTGAIRLDSHELDQMDHRTINQLDTYNSYAPLHYAVRANHVDAMRFLLQAGADANVADGFGRSPMFYADLDQLPKSSVELLESYGAKGPNSNNGCFAGTPAPKTQTTSRCKKCSIVILGLLLLASGGTTFLIWYLGQQQDKNNNSAASASSGQSQQANAGDSQVENDNESNGSSSPPNQAPTSSTPPPLVVTGVNPIPATNITTISPVPTFAPTTMPSLSVPQKDVIAPENPTLPPSEMPSLTPTTSAIVPSSAPTASSSSTSPPTVSATEIATEASTTTSPTWSPTAASLAPSTAPTVTATTESTASPTFLSATGPTNFPTFETIYPEFELPEDINLFEFLVENSLDEGATLRNPRSPQYQAFRWLSGNTGFTAFSDERKLQRYALATFYYSTYGDEWSNNDFWMSNEDECTMWFSRIGEFGPTDTICNEDGLITAIDLDYNNIRGKLPGELGLLKKLRRLELYGGPQTFLTGNLPTELALLTELESLSVRGNQLTGSIPASIGDFPALRTLNLSQNKFSSQIPSELGLLTSLTALSLETNTLSGTLPSEVGKILGLESLSIGTNKLSGQIPTELGELSQLRGLEAELNQFSSTLPSELGRLSNLSAFQLTINEISGALPSELGGLTGLQSLLLRGNNLSSTLPSEIGLLLNIQASVDLSFNSITGRIPSEMGKLTLLRGLYLNSNNFSGEIPTEIAQLSRLNTLRLESNNLIGAVPIDVCDVFGNTYPLFYADCMEVACSCCTYCCVDDAGCSCEYAGTANEFLC